MAQSATIYKLKIALSDLGQGNYESLLLTVAQHPSETVERMMVRVLVYCINADPGLSFGKGLSSETEPDLWIRTLDDQVSVWIEVGEPNFERIKKATRLANNVKVYSFNAKSTIWWSQGESKFSKLKAQFYQFDWSSIQTLAKLVKRNMDLSITINGESAFIADDEGGCEVFWKSIATD